MSNINSQEPGLLTVRDAAKRLDVTMRTLKYYEERGLVTPSRSDGGYRLYSEEDMERFGRILRLRQLGFSLHGITEMLKRPVEVLEDGRTGYSRASIEEMRASVAEQIEALDKRIAAAARELREARALRTELNDDLDYLTRRVAGEPAEALLPQRIAARKRHEKNLPEDDTAE